MGSSIYAVNSRNSFKNGLSTMYLYMDITSSLIELSISKVIISAVVDQTENISSSYDIGGYTNKYKNSPKRIDCQQTILRNHT